MVAALAPVRTLLYPVRHPWSLTFPVRHPRTFAARVLAFGTAAPATSGTVDVPVLAPPAAAYPVDRIAEVRLTDGTRVQLRPVVPADAVHLNASLARMSDRTRWLRFHSPVAHLPEVQVRHLVTVDHHDREAIVAEVRAGRRWQPVGIARFDRSTPTSAEIAIVIEDAWQGRGIGHALLSHLTQIAREVGLTQLTGEVLAENRAILGLLEAHAERLDVVRDGPELHTTSWIIPQGD